MSNTDDVVAKLDTLVRLAAIGLCGDKPQNEKIRILSSAGLPPKEIADIVGTTSNTVSVALSTLKKKDKKSQSRKKARGDS